MKLDKPVSGGPCWTELGTDDLAAAKRFYEGLFGWRAETDPRQEAGGYTIAHLGDAAVAALTPLYQEGQPVAWNVSFAVPDADAAAARVTGAGGSVLVGPMDVFDVAASRWSWTRRARPSSCGRRGHSRARGCSTRPARWAGWSC
jgi:predicted enzyme related to lactoylglutathione lyase